MAIALKTKVLAFSYNGASLGNRHAAKARRGFYQEQPRHLFVFASGNRRAVFELARHRVKGSAHHLLAQF